jgi:hypothetical protein
MKVTFLKLVSILVIAITTLHLNAKVPDQNPKSTVTESIIKEVALNRQIAFELAPLKTKSDAELFALDSSSIFDMLSESSKSIFLESLVFNDSGLVSFNYSVLESELTPTQSYKLLQLFGKQHVVHMLKNSRIETTSDFLLLKSKGLSIPSVDSDEIGKSLGGGAIGIGGDDHKGYKCVSRANCQETATYICMSSC